MKFLARQPILDRHRRLFAYELLFRSGPANFCDHPNLEEASVAMLDTSFLIGLQRLTDGQLGFVNCPRDFLLKDYVSLFPPNAVVVELLETIVPDAEVIEACRALKQRGYLLALDDFEDRVSWDPLVEIADFIKVDFRLTAPPQRQSLAARYAGKGIRMLAEKIETHEEFSEAAEMGYSLFQGYFFCRPEILRHRAIPAYKLAYLQLLQAVMAPDFKMDALAERIKLEPSITYKLLRYLNSPVFGLRVQIHSVSQALQLLGEREMRKWIAVVAVGVLADGKPDELMKIPLVRGRFCELLAPHAGMADQASDLFLLGLLSVTDAILDQPLDVILEELPVRNDIKEALLEQSVLELLRAATAPEFHIRELAQKIKHEASLTYRLLRYLNSAAFGFRAEIRSVPHALSLLGDSELRKWIAVVSVGVLAGGKPDELMTVPLVRGRFCELLAPEAGMPAHANDLFLLGLLSVMDAVLDQPLESILADLPVRAEIKEALQSRTGLYWQVLDLAIAHERADWEAVSRLASELHIDDEHVSALYISAVEWSTALRRGSRVPIATLK